GPAAVPPARSAQGAPRRAAGPAQRFRIGYQIYSWGRYFPAAWWRGAEAVGALGYPGVEGEYTIAELYEGREEEFAERMARCGVRLAALYSTTDLERAAEREENLRKNLQAAAFCRRQGAAMIVIGGTSATERTPALYAAWAREANTLGQRTLEEHGVRIGLHPHVGSLIETREEIARVMDATDPRWVFLAPDTGHLLAGGSDPVEIFRTYRERIVHAHLKDYAPAPGGGRGSFLPLGRGAIDFAALLAVARDAGLDGWLNVELDSGRGMSPEAVARAAREYLTGPLGVVLDPEAAASSRRSG
ncbi:MAG TPA: sugar phosphate isomerase/epimerase, partial [Vicinamibacterales bacterium]|nr:sugar phosphate isomerase/epimerase [Vicinamibacterales bacterium]